MFQYNNMYRVLRLVFFVCFFVYSNEYAIADHIPYHILLEIEREANEPYCLYDNRVSNTNFDCINPDPSYLDCYVSGLHDGLDSRNQALDLLGQLKISNTYYEYYDQPQHNEYLSQDYFEILDFNLFMCSWW